MSRWLDLQSENSHKKTRKLTSRAAAPVKYGAAALELKTVQQWNEIRRAIRAVSVVDIPILGDSVSTAAVGQQPGHMSVPGNYSANQRHSLSEYASEALGLIENLLSITLDFCYALAQFVCARASAIAKIIARFARRVFAPPPVPLRITVLAGVIFLALVTVPPRTAGWGQIDLTKLLAGDTQPEGRPRIVVQNGKLSNAGDGPARNLEVTKPRYRLIGDLDPGAAIDLPAEDFTVQFEWSENDRVQRATRSFKTSPEPDNVRAGERRSQTTLDAIAAAQASAPDGITAEYDPATHLLTVRAHKPVEVRVDGFLLRPISRTDENGTQYRYVQANVLVLGQDIRQGDTVQFEVVFTKPQDFYSIPIYVREPGKPPVYLTVSVSTKAAS